MNFITKLIIFNVMGLFVVFVFELLERKRVGGWLEHAHSKSRTDMGSPKLSKSPY